MGRLEELEYHPSRFGWYVWCMVAWLVLSTIQSVAEYAVLCGVLGRLFAGIPAAVTSIFAAAAFACVFLSLDVVGLVFSCVFSFLWTAVLIAEASVFNMVLKYTPPHRGVAPEGVPGFSALLFLLVFTCICTVVGFGVVALTAAFAPVARVVDRRGAEKHGEVELDPNPETAPVFTIPRDVKHARVTRSVAAASAAVAVVLFVPAIVSIGLAFTHGTRCPGAGDSVCFDGCEEMAAGGCLMPWPSSQYLVPDNTTGTGLRVDIPEGAWPWLRTPGWRLTPKYWNEYDGFAVSGPALFDLPGAASLAFSAVGTTSTQPNIDNFADKSAAITAVIDAKTLELVPHWAELDVAGLPDRPTVIIQPAVPLKFATRYVAVVRRMVDTATGKPAPAAPGFAAMLSGKSGKRWDNYRDNIRPVIAAALGWDEAEIQLAWDWTTFSRRFALGRIEAIRDDAIARGSTYKVVSVRDYDCSAAGANVGREVRGILTTPSYLVSGNRKRGSTLVARPGHVGPVEPTGSLHIDFEVDFPCSVVTGKKSPMLVQFGHGFFYRHQEIAKEWMRNAANDQGLVMFAADWYGMARFDMYHIFGMFLSHPDQLALFAEPVMQGHVVFASLLRVMRSSFASDPAAMLNGVRLYDPDKFAFWGISQGGILGGAYTAISTEFDRVAFNVPGAGFATIFSRSSFGMLFYNVLSFVLHNSRDKRIFFTAFQTIADPCESGGWATSLVTNPGPGNHAKQVIIGSAIGDGAVCNAATHVMARAFGAHTIHEQTRHIFGITEVPNGFNGSATITEWKFNGVPYEPMSNKPPPKGTPEPHVCPGKSRKFQMQMRTFFDTGIVYNFCNGTCASEMCD